MIKKRAIMHMRILVACMLLTLLFPKNIEATNTNMNAGLGMGTQIDAVLVMDASNSMNYTDPNRLGYEAIKMFIDMSLMTGDRIGFIAYTDKVERDIALLRIKNLEDKEDLKQQVADTQRGLYTDISVGLKAAVKNLDNYADPTHKPVIVILADGNNELSDKSTKTLADCDREVAASIADAQQKGYAVYTIGLNANGKLNGAYLKNISDQTGGQFFETNSADDLPGILSEILADHLELRLTNTEITANGDYQEVIVPVKDNNVIEANITLMSPNPVAITLHDPSGQEISIPSNGVVLTTSNTYSMVKLIAPQKGDWILKVKGLSGDKIKISLLYNYDLTLEIEPLTATSFQKGDTVNFTAYLYEGADKMDDTDLYDAIEFELVVEDVTAGTEQVIKGVTQAASFRASYTIQDEHAYAAYMKISHQSFFKETDRVTFEAVAAPVVTPPVVTPQVNPPVTQQELPEPETIPEPEKESNTGLIALIIGGVLVLAALAVFIVLLLKRSNKKLEGRFVIEVLDKNNGELSPPMYKSLNLYGKRTTLFELLDNKAEYRAAKDIIITPNPSAHSANPEVFIKNTGTACHIKRGTQLTDCTKKNGMLIGLKTKISVMLELQNKDIHITYKE